MSAAGIAGSLLGGRLADRFGYRRVVLAGSCLSIPLLPALLWADRAEIALGLLILVGFVFSTTYSPTVVMGQRYLPNRVGLASGVTMGLAVAVGGIASPFLGWLADHHGIRMALASTIVLPVVSAALALTLPDPGSVIHRRG
jgi:FSR family fosmidomycin resistance protein-like MFS transporter